MSLIDDNARRVALETIAHHMEALHTYYELLAGLSKIQPEQKAAHAWFKNEKIVKETCDAAELEFTAVMRRYRRWEDRIKRLRDV